VRLYDFKNQNNYVGYLSKTLFPDLDFLKDLKPHYKVLYTTQDLTYGTLLYHMRQSTLITMEAYMQPSIKFHYLFCQNT